MIKSECLSSEEDSMMVARLAAVVGAVACLGLFACGGDSISSSSGSLDSSFNPSSGYTLFRPPSFTNARGVETLLQPDGKIVVAGWGNNGANDELLVARFSRD